MKKFPIGVQSFPVLIERGYVYVDKTHLIYDLITQRKGPYSEKGAVPALGITHGFF